MDRSLDDIVTERHRGGGRGRRGGGGGGRRNDRNDYPRDGVRKARPTRSYTSSSLLILLVTSRILLGPGRSPSPAISTSDDGPEKYTQMNTSLTQAFLVFPQSFREDNRNIDSDWVHDKYDDNSGRRPVRAERRYSPEQVYETASAKLRVENLHYDLTEEDLDDLFNRIGPVQKLTLTYDRAGRSEGVAYVTYESAQDAKLAIREFDGANAKGQPIRLSAVPAGPSGGRSRNPFDYAVAPPRSLADRITVAPGARSRSLSPIRHSDVSGPPPANVDRYVPGQNRRSRSPLPRRERREGGRRPGVRRERGDRGSGRGGGERIARDGRPKKTQEELDAEMEDYWGNKGKDDGAETTETAAAVEPQDDIDMIS